MAAERVVWSHGSNVALYADFWNSRVCLMHLFNYISRSKLLAVY